MTDQTPGTSAFERLAAWDKQLSQRTLALRKTPRDAPATLGAHLGDSGIWIAIVAGALYPPLALPSFALALLVATCRVLVGVHYFTDVTVGLLLGLSGGASALTFAP